MGRDRSIYVGLRKHMGELKLSLHPAKWRMAFTCTAAAEHVTDGEDRVISRWEHSPELAKGWRRGAAITISTSNLGPGYPEKRVSGSGEVAWFPAPAAGEALRFDLLIGEPDAEQLTIRDTIGDVARVTLIDGHKVWIVASQHSVHAELEETFSQIRRQGTGRGWAWGSNNEDGSPILLDLSYSVADGHSTSPHP